ETWIVLKQIRKVITGALEKKRADKIIGSSLEAHLDIYVEKPVLEKIKNYQMDEISITSSFSYHEISDAIEGFSIEEIPNVKIIVSKTSSKKCQRCWKYKEELIRDEICDRCDDAIS
ncbi:MAG: isoleucine--tRNA ligase, partial [Pelagibacteraceae bacterium]|nr:isoleucine--tRNA ligase [Pelagibacteraceae bacterium]